MEALLPGCFSSPITRKCSFWLSLPITLLKKQKQQRNKTMRHFPNPLAGCFQFLWSLRTFSLLFSVTSLFCPLSPCVCAHARAHYIISLQSNKLQEGSQDAFFTWKSQVAACMWWVLSSVFANLNWILLSGWILKSVGLGSWGEWLSDDSGLGICVPVEFPWKAPGWKSAHLCA